MKKYIKEIVSNPLFSGSAFMIIGSNLVSFLNYLYHLVMGRMLGPSGYGELAALISLIGLLGIIPGSVNLVIIKYISQAKNENEVNTLIKWLKTKVFRTTLIFCILILVISPNISSFLNISRVFYIWLIAASFLFSVQSMVNRAILQGLLKFKEMVLSLLTENVAKLLIGVGLILFGLAVDGAMIAYVSAALLGVYITNFYLKIKKINKKESLPNIKSMLIFTVPVLLQTVSTTSIYSSDVILVKHFFSSHDAGIYASLSTLGKIIFFGTGPISAVMFPLVSQRRSRGEDYRKVFMYSFLMTAFFALVVLMIYLFIPQVAIRLLFGSLYLEAANLLIWFGIFMSLFTLSTLLINFSLSLGITKVVALPLIAAIAQITLILFFHETLFTVVFISTIVTALLLSVLLIYLSFGGNNIYERKISNRNKPDFNNRTSL